MLLRIKVIPNSSLNGLQKLPDGSFRAKLTASPVDGKANEALINLLSIEFSIAKSKLSIKQGFSSKNKLIEVLE